MDGDRKSSQLGYQENDRAERRNGNVHQGKPQGPKPPIDVTGPRLPRLVQSVTATRCFNCSTMLQPGTDLEGACPKCGAQLHCCKQCAHFEPSTRFQCLKPIPVRIPIKDQKNDCQLFYPRVTVARDTSAPAAGGSRMGPQHGGPVPRNPSEAKDAFERLFKK